MTSGRTLVENAAEAELPRLGFRRSKGIYVIDLALGVRGGVGLNVGNVSKGSVIVHPSITVTHDAVEREIAERGGHATPSGPTIVADLRELDEAADSEFLVSSDASARSALAYIAEKLDRFGIPWMREMATMEGLASGLERYLQMEPEFPRPIAYREIGRIDLAIASIEQTLSEYAGLPDETSIARFRKFASGLLPELEHARVT